MDEDLVGVRQMHDAALVRSARRRIGTAVAELADRPLDEAAAAAMLQALAAGRPATAALRRLAACNARQPSSDGASLGLERPQLASGGTA